MTNENGIASFTGVYGGNYTYAVTMPGYTGVSNDVVIGSNTNIYITLPDGNSEPVIDLPDEFVEYYLNSIEFNVEDYVYDFNDHFTDLTFTHEIISGVGDVSFDGQTYTITTTTPNTVTLRVTVTDSYGESSSDTVLLHFIDNQAPVITTFRAEPDNGAAPFIPYFLIYVDDVDGDDLVCTLEFGDGTQVVDNCDDLNGVAHTYMLPGTYDAVLTARDANYEVVAYEQVFVFERQYSSPHIDWFNLVDSSNGFMVPTDLTFDWSVSHPDGLDMVCTLRVNGANIPVNCIENNYVIEGYDLVGEGIFTLIAIDSDDNQVLRTITRTFYDNESGIDLNETEVDLRLDDVIVPGPFEFTLETLNETLGNRVIHVTPIITCNGIDNYLNSPSRQLSSSAYSTNEQGEGFLFNFRLSTQDFKLTVPTDVVCIFKVRIQDDYGTDITLLKNVEFKYPAYVPKLTSIRGKGTDIINFMSTTLKESVMVGYNVIEFRLINNEEEDKEITISMISQNLGIENYEDFNLRTGEEKIVSMTMLIDNDVEPGLYPVRFAVNDGSDKQVRYSYIRVE